MFNFNCDISCNFSWVGLFRVVLTVHIRAPSHPYCEITWNDNLLRQPGNINWNMRNFFRFKWENNTYKIQLSKFCLFISYQAYIFFLYFTWTIVNNKGRVHKLWLDKHQRRWTFFTPNWNCSNLTVETIEEMMLGDQILRVFRDRGTYRYNR